MTAPTTEQVREARERAAGELVLANNKALRSVNAAGNDCDCNECRASRLPVSPPTPEALAQRFHETYERLAPSFGYETRKESAKPWAEVPEQNRRLMVAVCAEILAASPAPPAEPPK